MIGTYKEIAPNTGYLHLTRMDKDIAFTINILYGDSKIIDQEVQKILKKNNTMEMILGTGNTLVTQANTLRAIGFIPKKTGGKGALENLCQSGSISNTQGLKDGNTDRHRDNITAHT